MNISVVITSYNSLALLKKNLSRVVGELADTNHHSFELIISDDASKDGSVSWLNSFKEAQTISTTVISSNGNRGFAKTANTGIRASRGELVVLLNSDVYPKPGFLAPAVSRFSDPLVFAVGFMDESIEEGNTVLRGRGIGWWGRGFYVHKRGDVDDDSTDWVSGGSGIFRKSMLDILNGFDEIYCPFYWEDIDLSYRSKRNGYKLYFERKSVVVHEHAKGSIKTAYSPDKVKEISYRNQFLFVWRNASLIQLAIHVVWFPYHVLRALIRGDYLFISGFGKALVRIISYHEKSI